LENGQNLCLLHVNTIHWAQIIVLFGLQGSVSKITIHFLLGDEFDDKCKIWQNVCLLYINTTHGAQMNILKLFESLAQIAVTVLFPIEVCLDGRDLSGIFVFNMNFLPFKTFKVELTLLNYLG